jgi:hypothetical protein
MTGHCLSGRRQLLVRATVYRTWYNDSTSWEPVGTTPTDTIRVPNAPTRYRIEKPGYRAVFVAHLPTNSPVGAGHVDGAAIHPRAVRRAEPRNGLHPRPAKCHGRHQQASLTRPPLRWEIFSSIETRSQTRSTKRSSTLVATPSATTGISNSPMTGSRYRGKQRFASSVDKTGRPGPRTWDAGAPPAGQEDFPVAGVSWYEGAVDAPTIAREHRTDRAQALRPSERGLPPEV